VTSLVFDTTALSHFARADRTNELQTAVADDDPVLLAEVAAELAQGIPGYPSLGSAMAGGWLKIRSFRTRVLDRATVEAIVDDLIATGMRLPVSTGGNLFAWAYEGGILP
jgi:hypothetical protein